MHDKNHHHHDEHHHHHDHAPEHGVQSVSELEKLRKITDHWIAHNEEHARSYRLWADRAREAGQQEPAEILEQIAADMAEQNKKLRKIIIILDSAERPD